MKDIPHFASLLLFVGTGLLAQQPSPQIPRDPLLYFYNPRLDALGQDLQKAASEVSNGQVYETQLSNLDAIARLATDRIYSSGRRAALAKIEASRTWGRLWVRVDAVQKSLELSASQRKEWEDRAAKLKAQLDSTAAATAQADGKLQSIGDLLENVGKAKQVAQAGAFLQQRKIGDVTPADLRIAARLQDLVGSAGATISGLTAEARPATTRSVADQMKVELATTEINHLKMLIDIEEKRQAGQQDVRDLLAAITSTLNCQSGKPCVLTFTDDDGASSTQNVAGNVAIEDSLKDLKGDKTKLKTVVYLLENYAALAGRAELPGRLAELRGAIEERRFTVRKEAIMARTYEQILLVGAQRISAYYKGGIKPETLAQFANAVSTAGLIPTIAIK